MKLLLILSLIVLSTYSSTIKLEDQLLRSLYSQWKLTHNKIYPTDNEDEARFETFTENYMEILKFNSMQDDVTLGLNEFADLTNLEFSALYLGYYPSGKPSNTTIAYFDTSYLAENVDWRTKGAVTAVKNQGACGSCWSFSAVGALEGLHYTKTGKLISFSEQQLVDCVTADKGCAGGLMADAFDYTAKAGGIETEEDYPYKAKDQKCGFDKEKAIQVNTGYKNVTKRSAEQLKAALNQQPVSVAIQANNLIFQFYRRGVIKRWCGHLLNHGVLAVGYDSTKGTEAFIVKNSWGTLWGDKGYVRISTDEKANHGAGVCGILQDASFPTSDEKELRIE